jgi:alpha-galactosidase
MGWNSWNYYACNVNENVLKSTMDAFISEGLLDYGYNYVNVDDCWQCSRLANGSIVACADTFPSGMKSLADYAHSLGLLFGLYSDAG